MVYSFTFPQEIIDSIQERIEFIERCLNDANPQDEAIAEIFELANSRQISLSQLREEFEQFSYKLNRFTKLLQAFNEKVTKGELAILLCVRCNFTLKQIVDISCNLLLKIDIRQTLKTLTLNLVKEFKKIRVEFISDIFHEEFEIYILVESTKHLLQSLIKASLRVNALSEEEINAFELGDITPQESEAMLISLASTKKWDQVYRNLA